MQLKREDYDRIKLGVVGKWSGIMDHFNIDVGTGEHKSCPICGGTDRFRWIDKDGQGTWFCNGCDPKAGDGWSLFMKALNIDFQESCKKIAPIIGAVESSTSKETRYDPKKMRELYKSSSPIMKGDLVWKYLCNRGLEKMDPPALRYAQKCYESETKEDHPAMLAIVQDQNGDALTFHRTYLTESGYKLNVKSPKKMMTPKKPTSGGAVRLYEWTEGVLGVAEGIETAIAVQIVRGIPVWACLGTSLLKSFRPPENITKLEIYGDNDHNFAGHAASYSLANRIYLERGIPVEVHFPLKQGSDFLDEIAEEIK